LFSPVNDRCRNFRVHSASRRLRDEEQEPDAQKRGLPAMDREYLIVCLSYGIVLTGERLRLELMKNQLIIYKNIKI
jgi:hypothetical protein